MRITRLRVTNFRGWADLDLQQAGHVLAFGEPRAGRTDLIAALTRVLDPRSTRMSPVVTDIHQRLVVPAPGQGSDGEGAGPDGEVGDVGVELGDSGSGESDPVDLEVTRASFAQVEVSLVDLGPDLEQEAMGALEPLTADLQIDDSGDASPTAALGLRIAYRVTYDSLEDSLEHLVYYPATSNPAAMQFARVPAAVRVLLPVIFLDASRPLQLRAEGLLRRLLHERDPDAVSDALRTLEAQVAQAAGNLSATPVVAQLLDAVLSPTGPARRAGDRLLTSGDVQFLPDDGTLAGILRAIQPVISLDQAGPLVLSRHGSTTAAVIAAAEAMILAASTRGAIIIGDDFGEGLDGGSAEHLTTSIKDSSSQVWLTTRRSEVARAFDVSELVRLTRREGSRLASRASTPTNKKEVAAQRHVHTQLLPALTATTVAVVEGRHDLTTLMAADRRAGPRLPLSAHGVRLITADVGDGGGGSQIPRVAVLAKSLGFRVVALIDNDPEKKSGGIVAEIRAACDVVVRLPERMAIERAILAGSTPRDLRAAASVISELGQQDPVANKDDVQVVEAIMRSLHKNGLHEPFLAALLDATSSRLPPVLGDAIEAVALAGALDYSGPSLVDLTYAPPKD